jgi:hypothetical protein
MIKRDFLATPQTPPLKNPGKSQAKKKDLATKKKIFISVKFFIYQYKNLFFYIFKKKDRACARTFFKR